MPFQRDLSPVWVIHKKARLVPVTKFALLECLTFIFFPFPCEHSHVKIGEEWREVDYMPLYAIILFPGKSIFILKDISFPFDDFADKRKPLFGLTEC